MDISNTLKKVEKALDLRFERDSSLYISKEDTESIKEAFYNSKFQNINAFIKKFGNKIVGKVILNNSWLIQFTKNEKELKKIFDNIDKEFLKDVSKDIIEDKIFSTTEFKLFVKQYYLESIPLKDCPKIYADTKELIQSRVTCFKRYLKEEYILENSASHIVRFIDSEFRTYPEIYNHVQIKDSSFLTSVFSDYDDMSDIIEWIISNKITDRKDKIWNSLFLLDKEIALKKSSEYISENPSWDNSITKFLIQRVLVKLSRVDVFEESVVGLYGNYYPIRLLFLHMIEPPRFKDKLLAHAIVDRFIDIGLPNKSESSVEKIVNWQEASSSKQGFKNRDEVIMSIRKDNQDFSNLKTLDYYTFHLNKTDKDVILDSYYNFSFDDNLKLLLTYYLAKFLSKRSIPKHFHELNNVAYIDEITNFIIKLNINTKFSKNFLKENQKYEELVRFNKR
jgi:hypothetical protein